MQCRFIFPGLLIPSRWSHKGMLWLVKFWKAIFFESVPYLYRRGEMFTLDARSITSWLVGRETLHQRYKGYSLTELVFLLCTFMQSLYSATILLTRTASWNCWGKLKKTLVFLCFQSSQQMIMKWESKSHQEAAGHRPLTWIHQSWRQSSVLGAPIKATFWNVKFTKTSLLWV